jgi:hypothetical protein
MHMDPVTSEMAAARSRMPKPSCCDFGLGGSVYPLNDPAALQAAGYLAPGKKTDAEGSAFPDFGEHEGAHEAALPPRIVDD